MFYKIDDKALHNWVLCQTLLSTLCFSNTHLSTPRYTRSAPVSAFKHILPPLNLHSSLTQFKTPVRACSEPQSLERFLLGFLTASYTYTTIIFIMCWTVCHLHWTWSLCHIPCYLTSGGYSVYWLMVYLSKYIHINNILPITAAPNPLKALYFSKKNSNLHKIFKN